jgi:Protein of unknown function (DUF2911)
MIKLVFSCVFIGVFILCCRNHSGKMVSDRLQHGPDTVVKATPNPYAPIDISPMDMSYFPANYPQLKMTHDLTTPPVMRVTYGRPHRQGRVIFGSLLKFGEPWRLGANEASEIEFFQPVTIQGKKINPGRFVIYCIPYEQKWTVILNGDLYTWGLKIDSTKDLMKFDVPAKKTSTDFEYFTMVFQAISGGADLVMAWDDTEARMPINF